MRDNFTGNVDAAARHEFQRAMPDDPPTPDEYRDDDLHLREAEEAEWDQPCGCPYEYHLNDCPHVQRDGNDTGMSKGDWLEVFSDPDYDFDHDDYPF